MITMVDTTPVPREKEKVGCTLCASVILYACICAQIYTHIAYAQI